MKKFAVALVALVALSVAGPASALEVSGDAYAGIYSQYLWRGLDFSGNLPVVQGGLDVSLGKFSVGYWTNMQLVTDESDPLLESGEVTETDIVLDYSTDLSELVSMSVGNITYAFNDSVNFPTTNELYLGVTLNTLLSPSLTVYWDWDEARKDSRDGLFYALSVGHTFELMDKAALNLGALASYNEESVGAYNDFHNYELSASLDFSPMENLTVSPSILFSDAIASDARDALEPKLVSGLAVTLDF